MSVLSIGNAELARQIYRLDSKFWDNQTVTRKAGFKHIGSGGTREVYRGPDGVAYKVGDEECNLREAKASRQFRKSVRLAKMDIVVPRARTYRVDGGYFVCAMEYVPPGRKLVQCESYTGHYASLNEDKNYDPTKCDCKPRGRECFGKVMKFMDDFGIDDMFSGNVIYSGKKFHIIDLGYQGYDYDTE